MPKPSKEAFAFLKGIFVGREQEIGEMEGVEDVEGIEFVEDGRITGALVYCFVPSPTRYVFISWLATSKPRQGIGRMLVELLIGLYPNDWVTLIVQRDNKGAQKFYKKLGFQYSKRISDENILYQRKPRSKRHGR